VQRQRPLTHGIEGPGVALLMDSITALFSISYVTILP
jgi:hypothetical protein